MDLEKYRNLFLEEATEHLSEMSRALLELEKDPAATDSIDVLFRMAHSIKGMAASLDFDSVSELAHALEDRMQQGRAAGRVEGAELGALFRGLQGLEDMVAAVRDRGESPAPLPELVRELSSLPAAEPGAAGKKAPGPPRRAF